MIGGLAQAEESYQYAGKPYGQVLFDDTPPEGSYDLVMRVSGHFVFSEPLSDTGGELRKFVPESWEFADGRTTLDESNSRSKFSAVVDPEGSILAWVFELTGDRDYNKPNGLTFTIASQYLPGMTPEGRDYGQITICTEMGLVFCADSGIDYGITVDDPGAWSAESVGD